MYAFYTKKMNLCWVCYSIVWKPNLGVIFRVI